MLFDSWIVIAKEWREWCCVRARSGWSMLILLIIAWSFVAPVLVGGLATGPLLIPVMWAALPLVLVGAMMADSIAGERERQTLETLLASRLPERAILLGKVAAITLLGWLLLFLGSFPGLLQQMVKPTDAAVSPATMSAVLLGVITPCVVMVVIVGALVSLYTASARFALLLTLAFAGFLMVGATVLAVGWVGAHSGNASATATPLAVIAAGLTLVDAGLLAWLLVAVHRDRLLAIG